MVNHFGLQRVVVPDIEAPLSRLSLRTLYLEPELLRLECRAWWFEVMAHVTKSTGKHNRDPTPALSKLKPKS